MIRRLSPRLLLAVLLATVPFLVTCDLLTDPKITAQVRWRADSTVVVGDVIQPAVLVSGDNNQNGQPRLMFSSSDRSVVDISSGCDSLIVKSRGVVMVHVALVGSSFGSNPPADSATVKAVAFGVQDSIRSRNLGSLGDTTRLVAHALKRSGAFIFGAPLRWSSSNPSVVT